MRKLLLATLTALALGIAGAVIGAIGPAMAQVPPIQPPPASLSNLGIPNPIPNSATSPIIHQGGGCSTNFGGYHHLMTADCNVDLQNDRLSQQSVDPSLLTILTPSGAGPVATEKPGITWKIAGTTYTVKYTIQSGDTNALVAAGIAGCMGATPGPNCTVTPTSPITTPLNSLNQQYQANQSLAIGNTPALIAGAAYFDVPWTVDASTTCPVAISTARTMTTTAASVLFSGVAPNVSRILTLAAPTMPPRL